MWTYLRFCSVHQILKRVTLPHNRGILVVISVGWLVFLGLRGKPYIPQHMFSFFFWDSVFTFNYRLNSEPRVYFAAPTKHTQTFEKPCVCTTATCKAVWVAVWGPGACASGPGTVTASLDNLYFCETVNSNPCNPHPRIWKACSWKHLGIFW